MVGLSEGVVALRNPVPAPHFHAKIRCPLFPVTANNPRRGISGASANINHPREEERYVPQYKDAP